MVCFGRVSFEGGGQGYEKYTLENVVWNCFETIAQHSIFELGGHQGGRATTRLLRRVLRRVLEIAFEKVLTRVLRRCLALGTGF